MNYRIFEILFIIIVFLVNPIVAIFLQILVCLQNKEEYQILTLIFILTGYLCLLNLYKIPESDLFFYNKSFFLASNISYIKYLLLKGKEPVFYTITYIINNLFSTNEKVYLFIINFTSYSFYEIAIYKLLKKIKAPIFDIIFVLLIISFFAQLFSLSAHIIRQFFATSIFTYGLVRRTLYNKKSYFYFIIAIFCHSTLLFFIPFLFLDKFIAKYGLLKILASLSIFVFIFKYLNDIADLILRGLHLPFISYIFSRIAQQEYYGLDKLNIENIIFIICIILVSLLLLLSKNYKNNAIKKRYNIFYVMIIFLNLFILLNLNNSEIALRFDFFNYFFFPIILYDLIDYLKLKFIYFQLVFMFIWIFFFYYRIDHGPWTYVFNNNLLLLNYFNLII